MDELFTATNIFLLIIFGVVSSLAQQLTEIKKELKKENEKHNKSQEEIILRLEQKLIELVNESQEQKR